MEVGKLKTNKTPIFYFIVDSASPDSPNATRLRNYYVTTEIDSYVEAFYYLVRSLCVPATDTAYRKWHTLYGKVFGSVSFDTFMKSVQSLPVKHFNIDTSETAARSRLMEKRNNDPQTSHMQETNLLVYPNRESSEEAAIELHRLRSELADTQSQLRTEKSRQVVNGLADAERTALMYQLEQARQDSEATRTKAKEGAERLRSTITALEERLERLMQQNEDTQRDLQAEHHNAVVALEDQFVKRETEMQAKFEEAVRDRDRRLTKAGNRIRFMDQKLAELTAELDLSRKENARLETNLGNAQSERDAFDIQAKHLRINVENLESAVREKERTVTQLEHDVRAKDEEMARLRAEAMRYKQEAARFAQFTSSLHAELRELDDSSATAADMLRRKVMRERMQQHQQIQMQHPQFF